MTSEAVQRAAARGQAAQRRATELEQLGQRLAERRPLTKDDVTRAAQAAHDAQVRRDDAAASSKAAHLRAAEQHERAAAAMDAAGKPWLGEKQRQGAAEE